MTKKKLVTDKKDNVKFLTNVKSLKINVMSDEDFHCEVDTVHCWSGMLPVDVLIWFWYGVWLSHEQPDNTSQFYIYTEHLIM